MTKTESLRVSAIAGSALVFMGLAGTVMAGETGGHSGGRFSRTCHAAYFMPVLG